MGRAKAEPRLISHKSFVYGHTLSFRHQPYLADLFAAVQDINRPLTIVVGAGVSMNAGLPSWRELIDGMAQQINDISLRTMVREDSADLMRKAELIVQLIKKDEPKKPTAQIIRKALYLQQANLSVGEQLATAVARLVRARGEWTNVRLLTTNFDTVLENALAQYFPEDRIQAFSLNKTGFRNWNAWRESNRIGVLHVHGVVQRRGEGRAKTPIILTESQFFKYAADVRRAISSSLENSCSLFVGLSISDPNLVGPLYEMQENKTDLRFALTVPDKVSGATDNNEATRYSFESAEFMENRFRLRSILLKSYSQLQQVLSDMSLAIIDPAKYQPNGHGEERTLVYGNRMVKALEYSYAKLGCNGSRQHIPLGDAAMALNEKLHRALRAPNGPVSLLRKFARAQDEHLKIGKSDNENFALFLWLRCRRPQRGYASYALNMVGTSAYVHREGWSIGPKEAITRDSKIAAAQAVFLGQPVLKNAEQPVGAPAWHGIVAYPIVLSSIESLRTISGMPADTVTVGAITLNSTRIVDKKSHSVQHAMESSSIIARLDDYQINDLFKTLVWVAGRVLQ
jgi:hypothetical protein